MDERSFIALLQRQWVFVVAFVLLGTVAALGYLAVAKPTYTARSELFVAIVGTDSSSDLVQGSNYSQQQARNYAVLATRQAVLDPVIADLRLETTRTELASRVEAAVPLNTSLITITVEDPSPDRAAEVANAIATSLTDVVGSLVPRRSDGTLPVRLRTVQTATPPNSPSAPDTRIVLIGGVLAGLVAGVALVAIRELLGNKLRSTEQIAQLTGLPVLGTISVDRNTARRPVAHADLGRSRRAEEFRQLRTNLHFLNTVKKSQFYVVTSSIPGEGKSSVSINIAAAMAADGDRVCLMEADLRRPSLAEPLDLEGGVGVTSVMTGRTNLDDALQSWGGQGLQVLLSGPLPPNPSELLGSGAAKELLAELSDRFDVVVIDCPPLGAVTDPAVIAGQVGGAVLVVGCGRVERREVQDSMEALRNSGTEILGVVANFAPLSRRNRYATTYATRDSVHSRVDAVGTDSRPDEAVAPQPPADDDAPSRA